MNYDPSRPLAVFLGPSLDRATAESMLRANYYPPVRMGDIYRLLGTGVRTIVIIDGVFHEVTPVWQREILAALDKNIEIVGAASMGALRAAELADFGMIGRGTIYEWYRNGIIDGDDEVAVMHCDADLDYALLSEPLVNTRYNLQRAVDRGLLARDEVAKILGSLKQTYFSERSSALIRECPTVTKMPGWRRCCAAPYPH